MEAGSKLRQPLLAPAIDGPVHLADPANFKFALQLRLLKEITTDRMR